MKKEIVKNQEETIKGNKRNDKKDQKNRK